MPFSSERARPVVVVDGPRPRSTALGAYLEGWHRALAAPYVVVGALLVTLIASVPAAAVVGGAVAVEVGDGLEGERAFGGWPGAWADELEHNRSDAAATLTRGILGFGGTLSAVGALVDGRSVHPSLVGPIVLYLVLWVFLSGGVIDRLARARPLGADVFLATCGRYMLRLVRVSLVAALGYWALFGLLRPLIFGVALSGLTSTPESGALTGRQLAAYAIFLAALGAFTIIADMARVRLVVEDRYSALAAWTSSWRFVRRRFGRMSGLFLLNLLGQLVLLRLWLQVAPGAATPPYVALAATLVYLVARIWARLAFIASETVFFQAELAHATYTAAPAVQWPDSASVEAIRNLRRP